MNAFLRALVALTLLLTVRVASADAHSNCMNECGLGEIRCTRPIVERGGVDVSACNKQFAACKASCPPPSPSGGTGNGGSNGGGAAQEARPKVVIPNFLGNSAPLPPALDTSATEGDAVAAEEERLRKEANFEAGQTYQSGEKARERTIALNRLLEAMGRSAGLDTHLTDPPPVLPPRLVPPKQRKAKISPVAPESLREGWPPELAVSGDPPRQCTAAVEVPATTIGTCAGLGEIKLRIVHGVAVLPNCEDDIVYVEATTFKHISLKFDLKLIAKEGGERQTQGSIGYWRAGFTRTVPGFPFTPFEGDMEGPKHVTVVEVSNLMAVDVDDATNRWLAANPQYDIRINPYASAYFGAWQEAKRCTTGPIRTTLSR